MLLKRLWLITLFLIVAFLAKQKFVFATSCCEGPSSSCLPGDVCYYDGVSGGVRCGTCGPPPPPANDTCGGTRGSCSGSCDCGTCRAPAKVANGDACSCHGSCGGPPDPTPTCSPTDPTGLAVSCSGNVATLSWNASSCASSYDLRVDDTTNPWTGTCSVVNPGDVCTNIGSLSYTDITTYDHPNTWWIHGNQGGLSGGVAGPSFMCPAPTCGRAGPAGNPVVSSTATTYDVYAYNVANAVSVVFPTWSANNGQDDIVWYPGTKQADGTTWKATINFANHTDLGQYYVHIYMNGNVWCGSDDFVRNSPPVPIAMATYSLGSVTPVTPDAGTANATSNSVCPAGAIKYYQRTDQLRCVATSSTYGAGWMQCGGATTCQQNLAAINSTVPNSGICYNTLAECQQVNENHICKPQFNSSGAPTKATFHINLTDADGPTDIKTAQLRWNGVVTNLALNPPSGNVVLAYATLDFTGINNVNTLPMDIRITDSLSDTGWTNLPYSFKAWNCQIPIVGNMYDSTVNGGAQCPSGVGFNTLAGDSMGYTRTEFNQVTPSNLTYVVNANQPPPLNSYTSLGSMIWGRTYRLNPNADLKASNIITRWVSSDVGTTTCSTTMTLNTAAFNPYTASAPIGFKTDFSAVVDQAHWYQVAGGGILAANSVANMVPITCKMPTCYPFMTTELSVGDSNNGLVSATTLTNNSGCSVSGVGAKCAYGSPNNWYKSVSSLSSTEKYNYQYFYDRYFSALGSGTTFVGDATMTAIKNKGGTGVFLVGGDLNIDVDNVVPSGSFLMIIVKGKTTIAAGVNQTQGILLADGGIVTAGVSATQLVISGMLYSSSSTGDIQFSRDFTDQTQNNTTPAVIVKYRPDFLFTMPSSLMKLLSNWNQY